MTTLQAVITLAFALSALGAVAIIAFLLLEELRRKPAPAKADPLPANIAPLMEGVPPPAGAEVVRLKTGSWVRVGTPAHEQAVRSGLVEK